MMKRIIEWFKKIPFDKLLHYTLALVAYLLLYNVLKHFINMYLAKGISTAIVIILCILKEVYDKKSYGLFDVKDLIAGVVGVLTGVFFT